MKISKTDFLIDQFYKNKLIFNLYKFITKIYSLTTSLIEEIIFRQKSFSKRFEKLGYIKFESKSNINNYKYLYKKTITGSSSSIKIIEKEKVDFFLNEIFNKELRRKITKTTGFNFSIDYFKVYENKNSRIDNKKCHFDKSFSKNMLKVFIPLNICKMSGPLKVYDKENSKKIINNKISNKLKYILLIGKGDFIYCLNPNTCFHKEGNPKINYSSQQIMFQLNPTNKWSYRNDLYQRQFTREKKFSSFSSFLNKKQFFK